VIQPIAKKMKNQEEVDDDKNRIDSQFDSKGSQTFGSFFFHGAGMIGAMES